jgi:hypothetical protein
MNKHLAVVVAIIVFLAFFIPFASSNPDGLERVIETYKVEEGSAFWNGIMSDYAISAITNPYISTLLSGAFGTLLVLAAAFLLGKVISQKASASE